MVGILPHPVIDFFSSCVAHTSGVFRFHKLSNLCVNALSIIQKWMVRVSFRCAVVCELATFVNLGLLCVLYVLALFIVTNIWSDGLGFVATI